MIITKRTTAAEYAEKTGWQFWMRGQQQNFAVAFNYFVHQSNIPLMELNKADREAAALLAAGRRAAWGPPSGSEWTLLFSLLQAIDLSQPVNPSRELSTGDRVKQFRWPTDPPGVQGNWFTWLGTTKDEMGLPTGQDTERGFVLVRPVRCLESTIADAFTRWAGDADDHDDYHPGGGTQLFVYNKGPGADAFRQE